MALNSIDLKHFTYHSTFCYIIDTTPNVDYFTRDEIKKVVRSFKELVASGDSEVSSSKNILYD